MPTLDERLLLDQLESKVGMAEFDSFNTVELLLQSDDWSTRASALSLVTKMKFVPANLVALAEVLLNDDNYLIRIEAVRAIYRHSPKERAIALLRNQDDSHHLVRAFITSYLKSLSDERPVEQ